LRVVSTNLGAMRLRTFALVVLCLILVWKGLTSAIWGVSEIAHGDVGYSVLAVGLLLVPVFVLANLQRSYRRNPPDQRRTTD
jgi:hypothetical protein